MPRRGENIRKRTDGRWEARLIDSRTGRYKYFYGTSYSEVKQKRYEYAAHINTVAAEKGVYMSEVLEIWLAEHNISAKQSTISNYKNIIELYLLPLFGSLDLKSVGIAEINRILSEWLKGAGANLSTKYCHDIIMVLRSALSFAEIKFNISINTKEIMSVPSRSNEITVLSEYEQRRLVAHLMPENDPISLGVILCLYTGMRLGEICALRWSDIHLGEGYISITKTLYRTKNIKNITVNGKIPKTIIVIGSPKTESSVRKIPISDFVEKLLIRHDKCCGEHYFLTNSSKYIEPRLYELYFKKILNDAGIEQTKFHTLRHTFATNCVNVGCDVKSLSEILGHSSVRITLDRYVHPSIQVKKAQLNKLEAFEL